MEELKALQSHSKDHQQDQKEKKMAVRYHKVKFFESKKLVKRKKNILQLLSSKNTAPEVAEDLRKELQQVHLDLDYIKFFPKGEKYLALFPRVPSTDPKHTDKLKRLRKLASERKIEELAQVDPQLLDDDADMKNVADDSFFSL